MADERWFHGTRRGFTPGGALFPKALHGGAGTTAPTLRESPADADRYVFMTTDLDLAWAYAYAAPGRGKPKVLELAPQGTIEHDPEHSAHMPAYRCDGWAKVLRVHTVPTITEAEAREGWQTA